MICLHNVLEHLKVLFSTYWFLGLEFRNILSCKLNKRHVVRTPGWQETEIKVPMK